MTENQKTLALMGWVPMRGLLDHLLWNPGWETVLRPCGGGYIWSNVQATTEQEIEWSQWPDSYAEMEKEALNEGRSAYSSGAYPR